MTSAILVLLLRTACSCSDFYMPTNNTEYRISVRTMDLGQDGGWNATATPRGLIRKQSKVPPPGAEPLVWTSKWGYVGFAAPKYGFPVNGAVGEAMNERGFSCGALALVPTVMPKCSTSLPNLHSDYVCQYAVEMWATVAEAKAGLGKLAIWGPLDNDVHWVFRDASGASLVLEFPADGTAHIHEDNNDGTNGFGIMTNEPPFEYHLLNAKHLAWKRALIRQAIPVPGSWYPEDRFMRVLMVKDTMPPPSSLQVAIAQAVAVLNTITVPMGSPPGTDSGKQSGELGLSDHSLFGVVRDHAEKTLYWRSAYGPSLTRLRLDDLDFAPGAQTRSVSVSAGAWYTDAQL